MTINYKAFRYLLYRQYVSRVTANLIALVYVAAKLPGMQSAYCTDRENRLRNRKK